MEHRPAAEAWRPACATALVLVTLLTACRHRFDQRLGQGGFPPPPSPAGALYGRVLRADGHAPSLATVELEQARSDGGSPALGSGCLATGACVNGASAPVNPGGAFVFPKRAVHPDLRPVVTAVLAPLDRTQWTGPQTSAALESGPRWAHRSGGAQKSRKIW